MNELETNTATDTLVSDLSRTIPVGKQKRFAANVAHMRRVSPPLAASRQKISRNGPCPCGVKPTKKFKHCCLALTKQEVFTNHEPALPIQPEHVNQ